MKLATITTFCREKFRVDNWIRYYNEYKDVVSLHIIVNNGDEVDTGYLTETFPNSLVLYCPGGNMAASYNKALEVIYKDADIDAIMHITNDIKISGEDIIKLYDYLYKYEDLCLVGPTVLFKDSEIVSGCGFKTKGFWGKSIPYFQNMKYSDITEDFMYVSYVTGGINMVKRSCYEQMGFQDEKMNMYRDEWDIYARMSKLGYREGVVLCAKCWHQHEYAPGTVVDRSASVLYYVNRNTIYLDKKHAGFIFSVLDGVRLLFRQILFLIYHILSFKFKLIKADLRGIQGVLNGFTNNMDNTK